MKAFYAVVALLSASIIGATPIALADNGMFSSQDITQQALIYTSHQFKLVTPR